MQNVEAWRKESSLPLYRLSSAECSYTFEVWDWEPVQLLIAIYIQMVNQ